MPYYTPPESDANGSLYAQVASGYVQDLAPVPDPETDEYADRAEAAEFLVYNYLKRTGGGTLTGESRSGLSASYAKVADIGAIVAPVMGSYYEGPASAANTGYIGDFA